MDYWQRATIAGWLQISDKEYNDLIQYEGLILKRCVIPSCDSSLQRKDDFLCRYHREAFNDWCSIQRVIEDKKTSDDKSTSCVQTAR